MIQLPQRLPETGRNAALYRRINLLIDYVRSITPSQSNRMRVAHWGTGMQFEARPTAEASGRKGESTWL
jgi:hypothetical protein